MSKPKANKKSVDDIFPVDVLIRIEQERHRERMAELERRKWREADCNGWNYHVYSLGSDRCTMCGAKKTS